MTLNPLANPKGIKLLCELCQKPAFIQCTKCRVTYYCNAEHQRADWIGIHEKICQLLIPLRTPEPFCSSDEERVHRKQQMSMRQKQMIDLTRTTGQKLLFEGKHDHAVPAAMQSLRFSIDVYGLASIELVPSYLILGEASIGLGRLSQAEEYLSQALWTVTKMPECSNAIKSKLYRNLGLLHAAKGEYDEALRNLADDIYHASLEFGTDDISTSGGYFHMANVFYRQMQQATAKSLFERVTTIWYDHLYRIVKIRSSTPHTKGILGLAEDIDSIESLNEAQQAEAVQVLNAIYDMHDGEQSSEGSAKAAHALAMLYYVLHDIEKAKEFGRKAVVASEGVQEEEFSKNIVEFMKVCERITV